MSKSHSGTFECQEQHNYEHVNFPQAIYAAPTTPHHHDTDMSEPNPTAAKSAEDALPVEGSSEQPEQPQNQEQEPLLKRIFDRLDELGVATVNVGFDGFGDDGQIESMDAKMKAEGHGLVLKRADFEGRPMYAAIEELIYGLLDTKHRGWQNDGGSFGTYTLDVARRELREKFDARAIGATSKQGRVTYHGPSVPSRDK